MKKFDRTLLQKREIVLATDTAINPDLTASLAPTRIINVMLGLNWAGLPTIRLTFKDADWQNILRASSPSLDTNSILMHSIKYVAMCAGCSTIHPDYLDVTFGSGGRLPVLEELREIFRTIGLVLEELSGFTWDFVLDNSVLYRPRRFGELKPVNDRVPVRGLYTLRWPARSWLSVAVDDPEWIDREIEYVRTLIEDIVGIESAYAIRQGGELNFTLTAMNETISQSALDELTELLLDEDLACV